MHSLNFHLRDSDKSRSHEAWKVIRYAVMSQGLKGRHDTEGKNVIVRKATHAQVQEFRRLLDDEQFGDIGIIVEEYVEI